VKLRAELSVIDRFHLLRFALFDQPD
jgi:hypothetical protein